MKVWEVAEMKFQTLVYHAKYVLPYILKEMDRKLAGMSNATKSKTRDVTRIVNMPKFPNICFFRYILRI